MSFCDARAGRGRMNPEAGTLSWVTAWVEGRSQGTVQVLNSSGAGGQLTADPTLARQARMQEAQQYEVSECTNTNTCALKGSEKGGIFSKAHHDVSVQNTLSVTKYQQAQCKDFFPTFLSTLNLSG